MTNIFVDLIRRSVDVLSEFVEESPSGSKRWDGNSYASTVRTPTDIQAAKWWGILTVLAAMLANQSLPLSQGQREYIERLLFGGMGSFNDFVLDTEIFGEKAKLVNSHLDRLRGDLYREFSKYKDDNGRRG
ncbi:MAG: hypothetical protein Q7T44_18360 [Parvibaculum sp.]|nr:hypothetical protein [Parvibaculum sp.]